MVNLAAHLFHSLAFCRGARENLPVHVVRSKVFLSGLIVLAFVAVAVGSKPAERAIEIPKIQLRSADARRESLAALESAWNSRALVHSPENAREERAFLNRLAYFVRATQGRETYAAACRFWNQAYHDHSSRYSDFIEDSS